MLLVMVYMTNGLAESGENLVKMWELVNRIRGCEVPFICMGDWNMTPEEMQKTEMMGSMGAVIKTPLGVEFSCSSGNRLLDYALVDRRLESVVVVESFWAVPCCMGSQHPQGTPHSNNEKFVHPADLPTRKCRQKWPGMKNRSAQQAPPEKAQKDARDQYSKSLFTHEDAELRGVSEKVGGLYHRWSAAAEDYIMKASVPGNTKSCWAGHDAENKNSAYPSP